MEETLTTWSEHLFCAHPSRGGSFQTDTGFVTDHVFISIHKNVWSSNCNVGPLMCEEFREEAFALLRQLSSAFCPTSFQSGSEPSCFQPALNTPVS